MYFKQKSNVIFRDYKSFGYITDNRNFGYKQSSSNENNIGDKILSESGSVFFSALDRRPQTLEEISRKIVEIFTDVDISIIMNDAREFYDMLEHEGFVVSGETEKECEEKDTRFSYKHFQSDISKRDISKTTIEKGKSTQDYFEEYFEGRPQLTNLHIEITSKCNERCIHCYIPHENKISNIDPDVFYNVLEQCKNLNLLHLTISGGEPMLHKNFCDFLKKCNEYNFSINVLSNLTLLNDEIIEEMKANPLLGVQVSLYSMNPSIHEEITQVKGSFEKTINAIIKLVDNNIPLQISCPIMKQNKDCYNDVVKWATNHNIRVGDDYVIIARYNHTTQNLNCRLSYNEIKELIKNKAADPTFTDQIKSSIEKKKDISPSDYVCSVCNSSICISENGNVYPCAGWQDYIVGNVNETSLNDIWNNSKKVKYLRDLRRQDFPKCLQCSDKDYCTMCMVRNANEDPQGNPLIVNEYYCEIAKISKQIMTAKNSAQEQ